MDMKTETGARHGNPFSWDLTADEERCRNFFDDIESMKQKFAFTFKFLKRSSGRLLSTNFDHHRVFSLLASLSADLGHE
jgi:hypothetical protein